MFCGKWKHNAAAILACLFFVCALLAPRSPDNFGNGLLPAYRATETHPKPEYSQERTAPLEIAKVFGRSHGCASAGPELIQQIARASIDSRLDAKLAASVADQESGCDPLSVSSRGAVGLMQVMPKIWKNRFDFSEVNLFNPQENISVGTKILSELVQQYGEQEALRRYQGVGAPSNVNYTSQVLGRIDGRVTTRSSTTETPVE